MSTEKHRPGPYHVNQSRFLTGNAPLGSDAKALYNQARFLYNWVKRGPIFTFVGPGPFEPGLVPDSSPYRHLNPDYDYTGDTYFAVITKVPFVAGVRHPVGAELFAWRYGADSTVSWQYPSGGVFQSTDMFRSYHDSHRDMDSVHFTQFPTQRITLYKDMFCMGDSGSDYSYCKLTFTKMMIGGLQIWEQPNFTSGMGQGSVTKFDSEEFNTGHQVRGYDASRRGLGNLIGASGDLIGRTGRVLLQSGHPVGIQTRSTDYVCLRNGRTDSYSHFMVQPKAQYEGDYVSCTTAVVVRAVGASVGNPGHVRFTAYPGSDTSVLTIDDDTEALYVDEGGLSVGRTRPTITIDFQAPTDGAIAIRSYAVFED